MTNNNDNNNIAWSTHSSNFIRNTVGPTLLLIICPLIVNIFSYICISDKFEYGNLYSFLKYSYMLTQSDNSKTEIYNFVTSEISKILTVLRSVIVLTVHIPIGRLTTHFC